MQSIDIPQILSEIIAAEGGFVNHPQDRGGPTKFGITLKTLEHWRGEAVGIEDVKALTREEAEEILRAQYLKQPKIDRLPAPLVVPVFDASVVHGPARAIRLLQTVLNEVARDLDLTPLRRDGILGERTLSFARHAMDAMGEYLINAYCDARAEYCQGIVTRDPSQKVFLRGWLARIDRLRMA